MYGWLDNALDVGITEREFWGMTLAELERVMRSRARQKKREQQERATFDYVLADLIGRSVARLYNSSNKMPELAEAYPQLFDAKEAEERKQQQRAELSAIRFRLFAEAHNKKLKEVQSDG